MSYGVALVTRESAPLIFLEGMKGSVFRVRIGVVKPLQSHQG